MPWVSAINDTGEALVADMGPSSALRLHYSARRCPTYSGNLLPAQVVKTAVAAGPKGVFHLAWEDPSRQIHVASVRVHCTQPR
jgi:hypothetical protein